MMATVVLAPCRSDLTAGTGNHHFCILPLHSAPPESVENPGGLSPSPPPPPARRDCTARWGRCSRASTLRKRGCPVAASLSGVWWEAREGGRGVEKCTKPFKNSSYSARRYVYCITRQVLRKVSFFFFFSKLSLLPIILFSYSLFLPIALLLFCFCAPGLNLTV